MKKESAPLWVDVVDQAVKLAPPDIQTKWQNLRPFVLEPGDSERIRAAADAWRARGGSGGTGSLAMVLNDWKVELHDIIADLRRRWDDPAAEALEGYLLHKVDVLCFEALENRCNEISEALHALADAHDALQESIENACRDAKLGAIVPAPVGVGGLAATWITGGAAAPGLAPTVGVVASPVIISFVTFVASAWDIYDQFVENCRASLDRLSVELKELGDGRGRWPRPWND